jgi:16S rRNA (cytidine1402-2'-O)-methyltransferase
MTGILYVVATPIGNLEDVTLRALRILRDVSVIAAEDTRRTARLLQHYSISTRTTSLHAHNERDKAAGLLARLAAGESIALVSDAGTPLVSDPGQGLVAAAHRAGIRVEAIPGPSAVMAALSASGLGSGPFVFLGFPPPKARERREWFQSLAAAGRLAIFFEAPHRFQQTLADLEAIFGSHHQIGVARELTKAHEELVIRPIERVRAQFSAPRGEFTVLVPPAEPRDPSPETLPTAAELRSELGLITKTTGVRGRAAVRILAERYARPVNVLYELVGREDEGGQ